MSNVSATLDGLSLEEFTIPFLTAVVENSADVTTLDASLYTDFTGKKRQWTLNWGKLDKTDYEALKAVYDNQFITNAYPTFVCTYYSINTPVRMTINESDVRLDGCYMMGVQVTLTESSAS